jgi:integrase
MGKRKREVYRNGDCTLGRRENGEAVADFRDENDKRHRVRLGVQFDDAERAKAALDQFAEARKAVRAQQAELTVEDIWTAWLKERAADGYSNDIYEANWVSLSAFFANRKPLLLVAQDYRDYAQKRFERGRRAWTVATELRRLNSCFKWAADTHMIPRRPKVWVPSPGEGRTRVLSVEEAKALVVGAQQGDPHINLFVVLAFATGARHTAILDLTWDRIDMGNRLIQYDEDVPPDPMNKSWRKGRATVPMNNAAYAALEVAKKGRETDFVIEHGGKRLKSVREGFRAAVERAGLGWYVVNAKGERVFKTDITPHTIRHTVATWLDEKSVETKRTSQLLGHGNIETTKLYTHSSAEVLRPVVEFLDAAFAPLPKISFVEAETDEETGANRGILSQRDNTERFSEHKDQPQTLD